MYHDDGDSDVRHMLSAPSRLTCLPTSDDGQVKSGGAELRQVQTPKVLSGSSTWHTGSALRQAWHCRLP